MLDSTAEVHFLTNLEERPRNYGELFDQMHGKEGKVHYVRIITGYYDESSIRQVIKWLGGRRDLGRKIVCEIYLNRTKQPDRIKLLEKLDREIRCKFAYHSGIYLFVEHFVHMKCFYIEGRRKATCLIGSNNLTRRALKDNEEIISKIQYDPTNGDDQSPGNLLYDYIWKFYENNRNDLCVHIDDYVQKPTPQPNNLRDYLLEGELWTERIAANPYSLPLDFPDELRNEASPNWEEFNGYLDAELKGSLNTRKLIQQCSLKDDDIRKKLNQIAQIEDEGTSGNSMWKNHTLETTLGYWGRIEDRSKINHELLKKHKKEKSHEIYLDILENSGTALKRKFLQWIHSILLAIQDHGIQVDKNSVWFAKPNELNEKNRIGRTSWDRKWGKKWDKHVERLKSKLKDGKYRTRLVGGVINTPVPDMRSDPYSLESFVESFVDSFRYSSQQQNRRKLTKDDEIKKLVKNCKPQQI